MVLTAEQQLKVALLYEKAAADRLGVPPQQRAAFARKAKWFRMKARIRAKKEAASALRAHLETVRREDTPVGYGADQSTVNGKAMRLVEPGRDALIEDARLVELRGAGEAAAKPRYRSIADRLTAARPTQG
jgi:hypothetical protein